MKIKNPSRCCIGNGFFLLLLSFLRLTHVYQTTEKLTSIPMTMTSSQLLHLFEKYSHDLSRLNSVTHCYWTLIFIVSTCRNRNPFTECCRKGSDGWDPPQSLRWSRHCQWPTRSSEISPWNLNHFTHLASVNFFQKKKRFARNKSEKIKIINRTPVLDPNWFCRRILTNGLTCRDISSSSLLLAIINQFQT